MYASAQLIDFLARARISFFDAKNPVGNSNCLILSLWMDTRSSFERSAAKPNLPAQCVKIILNCMPWH